MNKLPLDKDCFVTSITLAFLRKYGDQALDWDPYTVREAFEQGFKFDRMPQRMFDKLNCGLMLIGTDLYTASIEGFLTGNACMNNKVMAGDTAVFSNLEDCAWGIWEYINLNGDVTEDSRPTETFSPDIVTYIQEVANLNGVIRFPVWMQFAQKPDSELPDMTDDVDVFEQYMARQQDYMDSLTGYVTTRQAKLTEELAKLAKLGFIG